MIDNSELDKLIQYLKTKSNHDEIIKTSLLERVLNIKEELTSLDDLLMKKLKSLSKTDIESIITILNTLPKRVSKTRNFLVLYVKELFEKEFDNESNK